MITSYGGRDLSNLFIENYCGEGLTKHPRLGRGQSLIMRRRENYEPGRSSESKMIRFKEVEG